MRKFALAAMLAAAVTIASVPSEGAEQKSLSSMVTEASPAPHRPPTVLGIACNNDIYVGAVSILGAIAGALVTRGHGEYAKVIITAAGDKVGAGIAPRICEVFASTPDDVPSSPMLPDKTVPDSSLDNRIDEAKGHNCAAGQTYSFALGVCIGGSVAIVSPSDDARTDLLKPSGSTNGRWKALLEHTCPAGQTYNALLAECSPFIATAPSGRLRADLFKPSGSLDDREKTLSDHTCPPGQSYSALVSECVAPFAIGPSSENRPVNSFIQSGSFGNQIKALTHKCPAGQSYDEKSSVCIAHTMAEFAPDNLPMSERAGSHSVLADLTLCPQDQFYSASGKSCVGLKVVKACQPGERYNSILDKCVSVRSLGEQHVCGANEFYGEFSGKCIKLSSTPECPPSQLYNALRGKCISLLHPEQDGIVCNVGERKVFGICISAN